MGTAVPHVPDVRTITSSVSAQSTKHKQQGGRTEVLRQATNRGGASNTADENDNDTQGRDHETNVREHMPRDGSAAKAGNACPKAHTANAGALPGQKVPSPKKLRYHFRWCPSPTHADLMFMDLPMTQTSPAEFQHDRHHTETDSTLRCRAPAIRDPPTCGPSILKKCDTAATGSDHVVL